MNGVFNNREIAIGIWLSLILAWSLSKPEIRHAITGVIKAAFVPKLAGVYLITGLTTLIFCYILNLNNLWDFGQIKNTIYWYLGIALTSVFQLSKDTENPIYFNELVINNFKFIVLIEFIIVFYTFDIWLELIFMPILFLIGALIAYSDMKEEYANVKKSLNQLLMAIGSVIIFFTIYKLMTDFHSFAQINTIYDYLTPVLLSILFTPFLFILHRYVVYENTNTRLQFIIKDPSLHGYVKKLLFLRLYLNPKKLNLWFQLNQNNLIQTTDDVKDSIQNVITYLKNKANPPIVEMKSGWSPFKAQHYLKNHNLSTGVYKNIYDDVWHASSSYLQIGKDIFPNNIGYYMEGMNNAVQSLKVVLNINNNEDEKASYLILNETISKLIKQAVPEYNPQKVINALNSDQNFTETFENHIFTLKTEKWTNKHGHSIKFVIEVAKE